jgi:D-3-phosphoglycerate dehydrogenase
MRVQAWTFHPDDARAARLGVPFVPLDDLLRTSDVVSVHVKLTDQSRGLLGAREFGLLKPGALFVNTARAGVVDTAALIAALESGRLGGAGIDVFDEEPISSGHPLLALAHVVLTPHNADQTPEGMDILNGGAVDNVIAYLEGRPQNRVV